MPPTDTEKKTSGKTARNSANGSLPDEAEYQISEKTLSRRRSWWNYFKSAGKDNSTAATQSTDESTLGKYTKKVNKKEKMLFRAMIAFGGQRVFEYSEASAAYNKSADFKVIKIPNTDFLIDIKDVKEVLRFYQKEYIRLSALIIKMHGEKWESMKKNIDLGVEIANEMLDTFPSMEDESNILDDTHQTQLRQIREYYVIVRKSDKNIVDRKINKIYGVAFILDNPVGDSGTSDIKVDFALVHPWTQVPGKLDGQNLIEDDDYSSRYKVKGIGTYLLMKTVQQVLKKSNTKWISTEADNPKSAAIARKFRMKKA